MSDHLGRECEFCDKDAEVYFSGPGGFCYGCFNHDTEAYYFAKYEV